MTSRIFVLVAIVLSLAGCGKDRSLSRGAVIYAENCAICHGGDLRGGGGAGVVGLGKTPADLTVLSRNAGGVFPTGEVLALLQAYAEGAQVGRRMRPFTDLTSKDRQRLRVGGDRLRVSAPKAALLVFLEAAQLP